MFYINQKYQLPRIKESVSLVSVGLVSSCSSLSIWPDFEPNCTPFKDVEFSTKFSWTGFLSLLLFRSNKNIKRIIMMTSKPPMAPPIIS